MLLKGATLPDGRPISVYQTGWPDLHVHASTYSSARMESLSVLNSRQKVLIDAT